ncbi:hypothetical protein PTKIN_Ptkin16aG0031100 [Pterospermum kingtungense]
MEDGDTIDVIEWSINTVATESVLISPSCENGENPILIQVRGIGKADHKVFYMMGRNTPPRNLLLDYCNRTAAFHECGRLVHCGSYVNPDKTADDLDSVDRDIIDVVPVLRG